MQHGKGRAGNSSTAKTTRTPATGPTPSSARPASALKPPAGNTGAASAETPVPAGADKAVAKQDAASKVQPGPGESACGKRSEVYWDGEKAW